MAGGGRERIGRIQEHRPHGVPQTDGSVDPDRNEEGTVASESERGDGLQFLDERAPLGQLGRRNLAAGPDYSSSDGQATFGLKGASWPAGLWS